MNKNRYADLFGKESENAFGSKNVDEVRLKLLHNSQAIGNDCLVDDIQVRKKVLVPLDS